MRLRNIPGADDVLNNSPYVIQTPEQHKGSFSKIFENRNPIHIEIGMGKGRFITDMAILHPEINYIGIEMYSSVLLRAVQKMDRLAEDEKVPKNLRFLCVDARKLGEIFALDEIDKIYLNFSDPWPKARTAKRRLTSQQFLARYDQILQSDGIVEFKTDNTDLFDFSLEEIEPAGWKLLAMTRDLHKDPDMREGNIMTEYETKFSALGQKICKYVIAR